ncbi:SDR family oxidoreductase [Pseudonocardia sp. HH130630-07]|uniref:SDR family oxidoreductase n=1 Tax=Pseudonocardia sp. HH130630-07 TaxID=1690815 RepID=UPI000814D487|nr:SDR family oxidoreductase [Pseudonocardia sp. HH130630-07]ANY07759.1 short-chain dehydrogenase [Pseudonocardia sp. HH130630-07]
MSARGTVLVTGASSGLGRHCALTLARSGFTVLAGVRRGTDGERIAADARPGAVHPLRFDVTDEDAVRAAAAEAERLGGIRGLVNNAGICVSAPLECLPPDELRRQLEINVVGQVSVTQAFLPQLRRHRGRIVNVTSGLGSLAVPYMGAYAMAQFAKEAMSDALRRELAPLGVRVSVVQPGAILTPIWDKVSDTADEVLARSPDVADTYRDVFTRFLRGNAEGARTSRTTPDDVARAVLRALTAARPRTRYPVGRDARSAVRLARLLPDGLLDRRFVPLTHT